MKVLVGLCLLAMVSGEVTSKLQCSLSAADVPKEWIRMVDPCVKKMSSQVEAELNAALTYMAMGAHFSRDNINRPGFAELFFHSASEEREHAIKIIDYLLMRGELTLDISDLIGKPAPKATEWPDAVSALKDALRLEASVTEMIRDIIKVCEANETFNDYHLVDYLTGEFLEEQYKGQRVLAGHVSTLGRMMDFHGAIGEFLFDKTLHTE